MPGACRRFPTPAERAVTSESRLPRSPPSPSHPLDQIQVAKQPGVEQKAKQARQRRRPDDFFIAAEVGVHGGSEQPELKDDQDENEREHAVDYGGALFAGEWASD